MKIKPVSDRTIEVDGLKFVLRPRLWSDIVAGNEQIKQAGIQDLEHRAWGYMGFSVLSRIKEWEGVELEDESPAPCNEVNKNELFSQRPDLLNELVEKVLKEEGEEEKNSETSHTG